MAVEEDGVTPRGRRPLVLSLMRAAEADGEGPTRHTRQLSSLCWATTRWFGGAGAVVNLMAGDPHDSVVAAGTDTVSRRMAELPFTLGEGPARDAFDAHRPVLVPDLAGDAGLGWPGYTSTALALGVHAVFCVPLHVGAIQLGVLEWYDVRPRALDAEETAMLFEFAAMGTELLLGDPDVPLDVADRLGAVLDQREQVYQAQGMVMVDLGSDLAEAMARMRAHAFSRGVPLLVIAREVIGGLTLPGDTE